MVRLRNFYVSVGSSGAALVGMHFVVIALIANVGKRINAESIGVSATPIVAR